jgi:hypothetical protein
MMTMQHDDHIWLTVGGSAWAIQFIQPPIIYLWRGFYPDFEFSAVDVRNVDWDLYVALCVKMLQKNAD